MPSHRCQGSPSQRGIPRFVRLQVQPCSPFPQNVKYSFSTAAYKSFAHPKRELCL